MSPKPCRSVHSPAVEAARSGLYALQGHIVGNVRGGDDPTPPALPQVNRNRRFWYLRKSVRSLVCLRYSLCIGVYGVCGTVTPSEGVGIWPVSLTPSEGVESVRLRCGLCRGVYGVYGIVTPSEGVEPDGSLLYRRTSKYVRYIFLRILQNHYIRGI